MKRITAIAAVAALFATGVLIGALGTHLVYAQRLLWGRPAAPLAGRAPAWHLERTLDLSPRQSEEVREILRRTHEEAARLRQETLPQVREIMSRATEEIEAVLDDEQRERFREMRRRHRHRAEQILLGPPGGGRGPGPHRPGAGPHRPPGPPPR